MPQLVSILIPAYNAGRWVADAVSSALASTWPNIEVIVVDDGSTDDTRQVAARFESAGVKVFTQDNRGAAAARNTALRHARGDYIQWLDADDLLAPDKITSQMQRAGVGATSRVLLSGPHAEFTVSPKDAHEVPNALFRDLQPVDFLVTRFKENVWVSSCGWLVSRRLTELAGPWNENLSLDDDGEYFARMVMHSERIDFVPQARAYYRRAASGTMSRGTSVHACESLLESVRLCSQYLLSLEDSQRTRAAAVHYHQLCVDLGDCFHPDRGALYEPLRQSARALGGDLRPAQVSWKYWPLKVLFGWGAVRLASGLVSRAKVVGRLQRDRLVVRLNQSRDSRVPLSTMEQDDVV